MTQNQILEAYNREKFLKLLAVVGIDALGFLSYLIPGLGEISDTVIAPLSALLLFAVFKSRKISAFGFAEEILPFTDVIPTGTIFWVRRYVINNKETFEKYVQEKLKEQEVLNKYIVE
jgi:hypothetical protein